MKKLEGRAEEAVSCATQERDRALQSVKKRVITLKHAAELVKTAESSLVTANSAKDALDFVAFEIKSWMASELAAFVNAWVSRFFQKSPSNKPEDYVPSYRLDFDPESLDTPQVRPVSRCPANGSPHPSISAGNNRSNEAASPLVEHV